MKDYGRIIAAKDYNENVATKVIVRLWWDHSTHMCMCYFAKLTKLCPYGFKFECCRLLV